LARRAFTGDGYSKNTIGGDYARLLLSTV